VEPFLKCAIPVGRRPQDANRPHLRLRSDRRGEQAKGAEERATVHHDSPSVSSFCAIVTAMFAGSCQLCDPVDRRAGRAPEARHDRSHLSRSLDDLSCARRELGRNRYAESACGLKVNYEFELCRLQDRKF